MTKLTDAARMGDVGKVKRLIARGARVDTKEWGTNRTALMYAARKGSVECVEALIAAGADVNAETKYGKTVLQQAHRRVKRILRAAGAKRKIDFKEIGLVTGIVLAWATIALFIAVLMRWLSVPFPLWGAVLLGIVSAPFIAYLLIILLGRSDSNYRKIMLFAWAALTLGIALPLRWLSPWFPTWAPAGVFGLLAAPILCPLVLLLPESLTLPSRKQINEKAQTQTARPGF